MMRIFLGVLMLTMVLSASHKKIFVNLDEQRLDAYENGKQIFGSRISSGKEGHETPTGTFKVLQKERNHRSNLWPKPNGGARMPYMLRISWSGVAMHQGYVPNHPASHGCIRVPRRMARKLFNWADIGTPVLVGGAIWHYYDGEESSMEMIGYTHSEHLHMDSDGYEIVELYD
jgi:lipoprotein-anchoring transpeptidase ErfK/SrfK